jgi:serine/threonine protein kinase
MESAGAPSASGGAASSESTSERAARELLIAQQALDAYAVPELYAGRYKLSKQIGKGAYGAVYAATESFPGTTLPSRRVAIKHIINAFVTPTDARRIYREIKVQAHFSPAHPNILPLLEVIKPRDAPGFTHIYLVSELMETDLHRVVHSRQNLTSDHISYFIYQTLCALRVIHAAHILHRDLKPSNLLVNSDCACLRRPPPALPVSPARLRGRPRPPPPLHHRTPHLTPQTPQTRLGSLKMCDFGLARESDTSLSQALTEYVVTRWYRAPEVLLSGGRYTGSIDVWSVGCILGELLLRRPLFPGENYLHQLQLVTDTLGSPSEEDLEFVRAPAARAFMQKLPQTGGVPFSELFPHVRGPCLDLLRRMLTFDPSKRISVEEALAHPFFTRVRAARRAVSEDGAPPPAVFRMRVTGGSSALKLMPVDTLKARFYAELCGLAMTPTPSSGGRDAGAGEGLFAAALGGGEGGEGGAGAAAGGGGGGGGFGLPPPPPAQLPLRRPLPGAAMGSLPLPRGGGAPPPRGSPPVHAPPPPVGRAPAPGAAAAPRPALGAPPSGSQLPPAARALLGTLLSAASPPRPLAARYVMGVMGAGPSAAAAGTSRGAWRAHGADGGSGADYSSTRGGSKDEEARGGGGDDDDEEEEEEEEEEDHFSETFDDDNDLTEEVDARAAVSSPPPPAPVPGFSGLFSGSPHRTAAGGGGEGAAGGSAAAAQRQRAVDFVNSYSPQRIGAGGAPAPAPPAALSSLMGRLNLGGTGAGGGGGGGPTAGALLRRSSAPPPSGSPPPPARK